MPALPDGPFYVAEDRGDALPLPPFSAIPDDLDVVPTRRPAPRPASFRPGDEVPGGRSEYRPEHPDRRSGLLRAEQTEYPSRIYRVGMPRNLRWEPKTGTG